MSSSPRHAATPTCRFGDNGTPCGATDDLQPLTAGGFACPRHLKAAVDEFYSDAYQAAARAELLGFVGERDPDAVADVASELDRLGF